MDVRGSVPPEIVDRASGRDMNSICGGRKIIGAALAQTATNAHQCPITFLADIIPLHVHPSTAVNEILQHINECFLDDSFSARHWFRVPHKGWM